MGTINGHARPIVGGAGKFADHTNVTCSGVPGRIWVCCGVPPAGPIICTGIGPTKQADCFSQPAAALGFNDTSGLLYGITGVCHQAANRVLFSANQAINNKCRGIKASMALYGQFGIQTQMLKVRWALKGRLLAIGNLNLLLKKGLIIDWATKLNTCVNVQGDLPECAPPAGAVPPPSTSLDPQEKEFMAKLLSMNKQKPNIPEDEQQMDLLLHICSQSLPANKKDNLPLQMLKFYNDHLNKHADLAADFLENVINTQQFVALGNKNVLASQKKLSTLLGIKQFKLAMSAPEGEMYQLIEPDLALEKYGRKFSV